jgi:Rieske Fe-S protein
MSNTHDPGEDRQNDQIPSMEQVIRLDTFLDQLIADRPPTRQAVLTYELREYLLGAQLRLVREGVEVPDVAFLRALQDSITAAVSHKRRHGRRMDVSRGRLLRAAAGALAAAGCAGVGILADELRRSQHQPLDLVAGPGRWHDIAAVAEVAPGQAKGFAAGGVLGYLINDHHQLVAVSALCTHMGCRLKTTQGPLGLRCLCHGSRFSVDGAILAGPASVPLPRIALRIEGDRVYALGTAEDIGTA